MINKFTLYLFVLFSFFELQAQSPIFFDGRIIEWDNSNQVIDDADDGGFFDMLSFNIDNDQHFVYLTIEFENEINLTEDNPIVLYLDTDNNSNSGVQYNGIGADLVWNFGDNEGTFYYNNQNYFVGFSDVKMRALPSHTAKHFEVAFGKDVVVPFANQALFPNNSIRVIFADPTSGDHIPNLNASYEYFIDETAPASLSMPLEKLDAATVRLLNWNTEFDGILELNRRASFIEVLQATQPEIIAFQEVWASTEVDVSELLTEAFGENATWYVAKNQDNNIIASKYPFLGDYNILAGARLQAILIDLPDLYDDDLLIVNAHLSCCGADDNRQDQANAFANFILDVKDNSFTGFDVAPGTPFLLTGDLNLVGEYQQLETMLTGTTYDNGTVGGGPLDWNSGDLENLFARQTELPVAYTWRNDFSNFPPGKLDYVIYSSSVMDIENSYIIQTETMSADKLNQYNLNAEATSTASDHFPIVADLKISTIVDVFEQEVNSISVYPNPFKDELYITNDESPNTSIKVYNLNGTIVYYGESLKTQNKLYLNNLSAGIYLLQIDEYFIRIVKH